MKVLNGLFFALIGLTGLHAQDTAARKTSQHNMHKDTAGKPITTRTVHGKDADTVYTSTNFKIVKVNAKFPGDINEYLAKNLQYPEDARSNNIDGTVYIKFGSDLQLGTKIL